MTIASQVSKVSAVFCVVCMPSALMKHLLTLHAAAQCEIVLIDITVLAYGNNLSIKVLLAFFVYCLLKKLVEKLLAGKIVSRLFFEIQLD